jgi:hypothetical protein
MSADADALDRSVAEVGISEDREEERLGAEGSPIRDCLAGRSLSQQQRRQYAYFRVNIM